MKLPETIAADALSLAKLLLQFGHTNRITYHEDGITPESDTDHTVMLGVMACAFAARYAPHLDGGKITQYSLVHDLVEVYAGDVATFKVMSEQDVQAKEEAEARALERIKKEFDASFPWIAETIEAYESLTTPEARFVKVFDKTLPKLTHVLNDGVVMRELGHTKDSNRVFLDAQLAKLEATYGADQEAAMEFLRIVGDATGEVRYS